MNDVFAQMILAARRSTDRWMEILFPVFIALFWVISSILKSAKAKKAEGQKTGEKQLSIKPGGKPAEGVKDLPKGPFQKIRLALEAELQKQRQLQAEQARQARQAQRKVVRPRPAARQVPTIIKERAAQVPVLEPSTSEVEPKLQKLPEFTTKAIREVGTKRVRAPAEIPQSKHLAEILSDYSDPDELRRAILHYEILGRPLSLRGPEGHIIGL